METNTLYRDYFGVYLGVICFSEACQLLAVPDSAERSHTWQLKRHLAKAHG